MINDEKIDIVYLWCDGNDPVWREKKKRTLEALNKSFNKDAVDNYRFVSSDELKYSLRSVEKYAPWINNIFIITDNQIPDWLNTNHPKIHIVDHKDIFPGDALPCFNSVAIETRLPFVKGLSEYFLYANDDFFIWNKVDKEFFFTDDGKPICRLRQKIKNKRYKHIYGYSVKRVYDMVKEKYSSAPQYFHHHNIDSYRKSYFLDCIKAFQEDFNNTTYMKFREFDTAERSIVTYYMLANHLAEYVFVQKPWYNPFFKEESGYIKCNVKALKNINDKNYKLLCINDGARTTDEDRKMMETILNNKFPEKSQFEK